MKKILTYIAALFVGIGISLGGTAIAAQISVPSASSVGQLLTSLATGNWQASTSPTVWGTFTAKNFTATSTTAVSSFQQLLANSSTTLQNFTALKSTTTNATSTSLAVTGISTSTFTNGISITSGCFAIGSTCLTTGGSGSPGGADTQVQFNDAGSFAGETGFHYLKSPTSQLFVPEVRSSTYSDPTGVTSLNLGGTDVTLNSNGGLFKLNNGTAMLSLDTLGLTVARTATFQDKDGTVAYLSDIGGSGASTTLYADNGTFSGSNVFSSATRFGNSGENITLQGNGFLQLGTGHPQAPFAVLSDNITFAFDGTADPATNGGGISFTANNGGTGNTNGGSVSFTSGLPSGTGATGTVKFYTGSDLIFEGASSTVATSTFYSNLHVKGGLKIGDASILLQGNSTSTFSKGIELTGGCFKVAGACLSSGGSGASSTLLGDSSTFTGANSFATMLVTGSSTFQNFTGLNSTTTNATTTSLYTTRFTPSGLGACNSSTQKPVTDGAGNWTCGTDTSGSSGTANATNTIDWIIYPYGSNVAVWRAKTQSAVTTFADFDDASNYVVNLATSSVPAENSIKIATGVYQVNATTTMDGNGVGFSAVKLFWYGNGTSTMLVVNNNTSAFNLQNRARAHFENIGFNLNGGADAFYASTTQATPVSSMAESEFFGIKAYSSSVNHTGWVFHFKDAFRYHIMDFHAKDVGNCFSDENNYSNASFINGDGQIDGFNFCELNNPTAGVNNGGRVVSLYGRQGLVNQMVFKNINGITNSNNSTMFYINHASRVVIEDNNSEQFATTTDIINSNGVNMRTTKYMTPWNGLANATLISTDANSYNNTFSLAEVELSAATYIFKDSNTIAPTRPNVMQGYNGGQFTFSDNGGSALWATTTSTVVRDIFDNIGAGTNSYLGRVKITGGNIAMDFLNSRTTLFQYANSAYRWFVAGTERMNLSSTGDLTLPTGGFAANASSSFQNLTALKATTTAATTTDFTVTDAPIFTALTGLLKGNGSSPLTAAVNGTDFTLITANTCGAGQHFSGVTAAGVFTCSADSGGGGGGGSGIGWTWNSINSLYMSTTTDDLLAGASATSSNAKIEVIDNGLVAWFASTTGAAIRPIFTVFRNTSTGISGIGINSSSTEDAITINGTANFDPMFDGCDLLGIGTVTTDQLAGQLCDWLALDSVTDGGILMGTPSTGIEANMPFYTILRSGDTTSWAANEGVWLKSHRAVPATTTLMVEALLRTPNVNVATTTGTYVFGLGNVGAGSLTTTAAYAAPTDTCSFQASSTANWIAVVRKASTYNAWDVTVATSTTQSTFRRFRITQDLNNGCQFYVDGTLVASEPAATSPVVPMQLVLGEGNNGAGTGTIGTSQNHYFYFAEQKMGWGRWKPK